MNAQEVKELMSRIECAAELGLPILEAIERVAQAVDRVFKLAMRSDLK